MKKTSSFQNSLIWFGAGSGPMDHAFDLKPEYRQEA